MSELWFAAPALALALSLFALAPLGAQVLRRVWCLFEIFKTVSFKGVGHLLVLAHEVNLMGLKDIFLRLDVAGGRGGQEHSCSCCGLWSWHLPQHMTAAG